MKLSASAGAGRLGPALLETPRLVLRELVAADLDFIAVVMADPEVMRFYPQPFDRQQARAWLERQLLRYRRDGPGFWLVAERIGIRPGRRVQFHGLEHMVYRMEAGDVDASG